MARKNCKETRVSVGKRCECHTRAGVRFSKNSACGLGTKKTAKRHKSKNCHFTPKGHCMCKTKSGGHTFAKKSRCR